MDLFVFILQKIHHYLIASTIHQLKYYKWGKLEKEKTIYKGYIVEFWDVERIKCLCKCLNNLTDINIIILCLKVKKQKNMIELIVKIEVFLG